MALVAAFGHSKGYVARVRQMCELSGNSSIENSEQEKRLLLPQQFFNVSCERVPVYDAIMRDGYPALTINQDGFR